MKKFTTLVAVVAAMTSVVGITGAKAREPAPHNDYSIICFPLNEAFGYGQCLERSNGASTWYWYDADGNWGEGTNP